MSQHPAQQPAPSLAANSAIGAPYVPHQKSWRRFATAARAGLAGSRAAQDQYLAWRRSLGTGVAARETLLTALLGPSGETARTEALCRAAVAVAHELGRGHDGPERALRQVLEAAEAADHFGETSGRIPPEAGYHRRPGVPARWPALEVAIATLTPLDPAAATLLCGLGLSLSLEGPVSRALKAARAAGPWAAGVMLLLGAAAPQGLRGDERELALSLLLTRPARIRDWALSTYGESYTAEQYARARVLWAQNLIPPDWAQDLAPDVRRRWWSGALSREQAGDLRASLIASGDPVALGLSGLGAGEGSWVLPGFTLPLTAYLTEAQRAQAMTLHAGALLSHSADDVAAVMSLLTILRAQGEQLPEPDELARACTQAHAQPPSPPVLYAPHDPRQQRLNAAYARVHPDWQVRSAEDDPDKRRYFLPEDTLARARQARHTGQRIG